MLCFSFILYISLRICSSIINFADPIFCWCGQDLHRSDLRYVHLLRLRNSLCMDKWSEVKLQRVKAVMDHETGHCPFFISEETNPYFSHYLQQILGILNLMNFWKCYLFTCTNNQPRLHRRLTFDMMNLSFDAKERKPIFLPPTSSRLNGSWVLSDEFLIDLLDYY